MDNGFRRLKCFKNQKRQGRSHCTITNFCMVHTMRRSWSVGRLLARLYCWICKPCGGRQIYYVPFTIRSTKPHVLITVCNTEWMVLVCGVLSKDPIEILIHFGLLTARTSPSMERHLLVLFGSVKLLSTRDIFPNDLRMFGAYNSISVTSMLRAVNVIVLVKKGLMNSNIR